jgi:hypothetical protein
VLNTAVSPANTPAVSIHPLPPRVKKHLPKDKRTPAHIRKKFIAVINKLRDGEEIKFSKLQQNCFSNEQRATENVRWAVERGLLRIEPYNLSGLEENATRMIFTRIGAKFEVPAEETLNDPLCDACLFLAIYVRRKLFADFLRAFKTNRMFSISNVSDYFIEHAKLKNTFAVHTRTCVLVSEEISWGIAVGLVKQLTPLLNDKPYFDDQYVFLKIDDADSLNVELVDTLDHGTNSCQIIFEGGGPIETPVLTGEVDLQRKQIHVFCVFCGVEHTHGWPSGSLDPNYREHRLCHCVPKQSPFHDGGYYVSVTPGNVSGVK